MDTEDSLENMISRGIENIRTKGIFWFELPQPAHLQVYNGLRKAFSQPVLLMRPEPWEEFVVIDIMKYSDWPGWLAPQAILRNDLKNKGVPEKDRPDLPEGM